MEDNEYKYTLDEIDNAIDLPATAANGPLTRFIIEWLHANAEALQEDADIYVKEEA